MPSSHETFFRFGTYAVVGHSAKKPFPRLTYGGLKRQGKTVYAIDPSVERLDDDRAYPDLTSLPGAVDAVVIEVPREETLAWVERVAAAGVKDVWLHMKSDTPEALAYARDHGLDVRHGTCAVQYLDHGFPHNVHAFIRRALGRW